MWLYPGHRWDLSENPSHRGSPYSLPRVYKEQYPRKPQSAREIAWIHFQQCFWSILNISRHVLEVSGCFRLIFKKSIFSIFLVGPLFCPKALSTILTLRISWEVKGQKIIFSECPYKLLSMSSNYPEMFRHKIITNGGEKYTALETALRIKIMLLF